MPTYSYACTTCEHRFDTVQAFTDSSLTECPECSGRLRKLFSSVGIVFKGSGFYRTDSRAKPAEGTSEGKPEGKKEGKSDGKKDAEKASSASGSGSSSGSSTSGSSASKPAATTS